MREASNGKKGWKRKKSFFNKSSNARKTHDITLRLQVSMLNNNRISAFVVPLSSVTILLQQSP
jgi:hypothetical protein